MIRYEGADPDFSALRAPEWIVEERSHRSRQEALGIAQEVAKLGQLHPERFASLARSYSEDLTTRETGGSLGTWSAALMFPEFLDAISAMETGQVSDVIETSMGFHVIALRETPDEQLVAADEIVIGYATAALIKALEGRSIARSRQEALDLAARVSGEAKADTTKFELLVGMYSDHESARNNGDIGTWSTYEPYIYHREIEAIAELQIGEISEPIDSAMGFRIFRRRAHGTRATPAHKYQTTIPRPADIDVEYMVRNAMSPEMAAAYVAQLGRTIQNTDPPLEPAQLELVHNMFVQLEADMRNADAEERLRGLKDFRTELKHALGDKLYAALQGQLHSQIRAQIAPELAHSILR